MLEEKVAIITGAASGLGEAMAVRLLEEGARVIVADRDLEGATEVCATASNGAAVPRQCDVSDEQDIERLFAGVVDDFGRLDVLINNAGITRDAFAHRMSLSDFRAVIDVHIQGSWLGCRAALRHMRAREGGGSIINMSSLSGKVGNVGQTNYSTAKAGIVGLTKAVAKEGARFGIRANAIQPGLIATPMTLSMPDDAWRQKLLEIPLGRAGEPSEVANVAAFLASDLASYITGCVIEVTGGRSM